MEKSQHHFHKPESCEETDKDSIPAGLTKVTRIFPKPSEPADCPVAYRGAAGIDIP